MKVLVLLASILAASQVFARPNQAELSCKTSFGSNGSTFLGYQIEITKTNVDYVGVMSPICTTCLATPTIIHFEKKMAGTNAIYKSGEARLIVALESLVPTRTHAALYNSKSLNKGKAVSFVCEN